MICKEIFFLNRFSACGVIKRGDYLIGENFVVPENMGTNFLEDTTGRYRGSDGHGLALCVYFGVRPRRRSIFCVTPLANDVSKLKNQVPLHRT
jgi:hypothetical protein